MCGRAATGGRCVQENVDELILQKGDRLEPTPEFPTPLSFDDSRPRGAERLRLTFWRRSAETSVRHRNPIFEPDTYVDPERVAADSLHSLSLGLFLYWINACLWAIVDSDLFRIGGSTQGGVILGTLGRIRAALENWCKRECKAGRERTVPGNFTEGMMNSRGAPAKLQGAESNSVLVFLTTVFLPEYRRDTTAVGPYLVVWTALKATGEALNSMRQVLHDYKGNPTADAKQDRTQIKTMK